MNTSDRVLVLLVAISGVLGCHRGREKRSDHPSSASPVYDVPRTVDPIAIDGKCLETSWRTAFRSPLFTDSHGRPVPFTQIFATATSDTLYLAVYVGDVDVRTNDEVRLDVGSLHIVTRPRGAVAPPGVKLAVDTDATIDDPSHDDEEWITEIAIPWSLLGTRTPTIRAFRIDVGHGEPHALAWPPYSTATLRFHG